MNRNKIFNQFHIEKNYFKIEKDDLENYLPFSIISEINNMDEKDTSKITNHSSFGSIFTDSSSFNVVNK